MVVLARVVAAAKQFAVQQKMRQKRADVPWSAQEEKELMNGIEAFYENNPTKKKLSLVEILDGSVIMKQNGRTTWALSTRWKLLKNRRSRLH